jgi:hypothetical protein
LKGWGRKPDAVPLSPFAQSPPIRITPPIPMPCLHLCSERGRAVSGCPLRPLLAGGRLRALAARKG